MKPDHYCLNCKTLVFVGYKIDDEPRTIQRWNNHICPKCKKGEELYPIDIVKKEVIEKAISLTRFKKLKRVLK